MKTIYRTIIAAVAASMALVSCVEENLGQPVRYKVSESDGARVITVSFGPNTKSTLDGLQPKFSAGDTLMISNGVEIPEERLVKIDDQGNAYFTTDLKGALRAVYPASAAALEKNIKQKDSIVGVKVPAAQSGKFAAANICMADIRDAATTATFNNQVAILKFYVDKSIGVKSITVSSTEGDLASGSKTITVDPEADATINTITDDPQKRICYVAVLPGVKTNLKFSSTTTTQGDSPVERTLASATLERNGMYNAFIPYYIDLGKAGKWAYCNIGAFLPEEPGKYFAWGDTVGQTWNGSSWTGSFQTISGNPDTLKLENDAAHVIWDGSWRMPTKAQLDTLAASTKEWIEDKGYKLYTASDTLFLPAAGSSADMGKVGTSGEYWSSSLNTEGEKTLAHKLGISDGSATTATMNRTVGANIRPFRHIPVDSIKLNKTKDTVKIGEQFVDTLIATIYPANASDTLVTWTSSNTAVATVERGIVTGKAGGTATITAKIIDLNGTEKSATCEVTVPAKVTGVTLNKTSIAALNVGSTETLTATISPSANTIIVSTTWSSDKPSIATVDNNGKVTGVAPGDATITVTVKDVYDIEKTATCAVTVLSPVAEVNGDFSVSSTLKVRFAKGNLKYDVVTQKWGTYDKQYEFNNSSTYDSDHKNLITLFTWGYNATQSIIPDGEHKDNVNVTSGFDLSQSQDWGFVFGEDNSPWRTLTKAEWEYLLGRNKHKHQVTVCDVKGCLVLAPDNFSGTIADSYDADAWATAENAGLVCLPPAGYRKNKTSISLSMSAEIGVIGYYWTSTDANGTNGSAYNMTFANSAGNAPKCTAEQKNKGNAVRLVKNVK